MIKLMNIRYKGDKGTYKIINFEPEYLLEFVGKSQDDYFMYSYSSMEEAKRFMEKFDKYKDKEI